uniref:TERF1-interacting nuclear factor 2 N-terminal domain-containing protein n=1 Tax=Periophthalmus magnuspinnatus TaxID=409849 RepID=A0A3B4BFY7_9GOBI
PGPAPGPGPERPGPTRPGPTRPGPERPGPERPGPERPGPRAVEHYGLLEDFISTLHRAIPGLLSPSERVRISLGLRAKVTHGKRI